MESEAAGTDDCGRHLPPPENPRSPCALKLRRRGESDAEAFHLVQVAADSQLTREEGQTMAEYGIVLAVITIAVIGD